MEAPRPRALAAVNLPAIAGYKLPGAALRRHWVVRKLKYQAKAEAHRNEAGGEREAPLPHGARAGRRPQVGASNRPHPGLVGPFPFSFVVGQEPCARRGADPRAPPLPVPQRALG